MRRTTPEPTRRRGAGTRLAALALAALTAACFEEPVEERLHLCFQPDGTLVITASTRINPVPGTDANPSFRRRVADVRRSLEMGDDAWRRRFAALAPLVERTVLDRSEGEVYELRRSAAGIQADGMREFFAEAGIPAYYEVRDGRAELSLSPGPAGRASHEQRKRVETAVAAWSELLARYAADTAALYGYLARRPERAQACFSVLFSSVTRSRGEALEEEEEPLVSAVDGDIDQAVKIFEVAEKDVYTLNELSHLVFDPFPGRVEVHLAAAAEEVEGFRDTGGGTLAVGGLGLWEAFEALEGRWLAPDPLLAAVRAHRDQVHAFDVTAFASTPRWAAPPPDAREVRAAVVAWLVPASLYRVAWASGEAGEGGESGGFSWDRVRCP